MIVFAYLMVVLGLVVIVVAPFDLPTKLATTGDWLALGAFGFAVIAAGIATLAYGVTILKPDLRAEVRFGHGACGALLLVTPTEGPPQNRGVIPSMQSHLSIRLQNDGPVSARNPALQVKLVGMMFSRREQKGWSLGGHFHGLGGYEWAQWDGGADFSIHPKWGRDLPFLTLDGVTVFQKPDPALHLEVVADGFSITQDIPITLHEGVSQSDAH